jgi:hypothetical protein
VVAPRVMCRTVVKTENGNGIVSQCDDNHDTSNLILPFPVV